VASIAQGTCKRIVRKDFVLLLLCLPSTVGHPNDTSLSRPPSGKEALILAVLLIQKRKGDVEKERNGRKLAEPGRKKRKGRKSTENVLIVETTTRAVTSSIVSTVIDIRADRREAEVQPGVLARVGVTHAA
jgi:hypothetical protein